LASKTANPLALLVLFPKAVATPVPNEVKPVPPEAIPKVPAKVTAPPVAVLGVNPDKEVWKLVTSPVPLTAIVIPPDELVTEIPVPAVMVEREYPLPFPINNCPFVGVEDNPVPP